MTTAWNEDMMPVAGYEDADLPIKLAELARDIHAKSELGVNVVLPEITCAATEVIEAVEFAGITLTSGRNVESVAPTDGVAEQFDRLQQQVGEGPCLDAATHHRTVRTTDLTTDERWPALSAVIRDVSPIRSVVSYELFTHSEGLGALNLYSPVADGFDDDAVEKGYALAAHAALVFDAARRHEQFQSALASRDVIGQAKGMIMERFGVDAGRAFDLLRKLSQDSNIALAEVARRLTAEPTRPSSRERP